ncbi:MAG: hypothetical protein IPI72_09800 [Flavobacteriales bacterium]|nr:hypothetical protein [Flavobacteriales bacterium]
MLTTTSPGIVHIWTGTEFDTLFHFSAVPGDQWQAPGDWTFTETRIEVTDTGHVALEGRSVRYQTIDLSFDDVVWVSDTVYEGIGPVQMYLNIPISYQVMIDGGYGGYAAIPTRRSTSTVLKVLVRCPWGGVNGT